jgi:hypothetical protein
VENQSVHLTTFWRAIVGSDTAIPVSGAEKAGDNFFARIDSAFSATYSHTRPQRDFEVLFSD